MSPRRASLQVTPLMQSTRGMMSGLSEGLETVLDRVSNATEGRGIDMSQLRGLPRDLLTV